MKLDVNLQLVDVVLGHHLRAAAAGAEADRRRAVRAGHRTEGHPGGGGLHTAGGNRVKLLALPSPSPGTNSENPVSSAELRVEMFREKGTGGKVVSKSQNNSLNRRVPAGKQRRSSPCQTALCGRPHTHFMSRSSKLFSRPVQNDLLDELSPERVRGGGVKGGAAGTCSWEEQFCCDVTAPELQPSLTSANKFVLPQKKIPH